MERERSSKKGLVDHIEKIGNIIPHPLLLFLYISGIVIVISFICNKLGISAISPSNGEVITVKNLITLQALTSFMKRFIENFQNFPVLGPVVVLAVASGFAEKVGFLKTVCEMFLKNTKGNRVVFVAAFIATLGKLFGDSAFLIVPLITATLFKGVNRNPIAGLLMGYASVGGGFAAGIIPGAAELILTPITIASAKMIDLNFDTSVMSTYYFSFTLTFFIAVTSAIITLKFIEPKLGEYVSIEEIETEEENELNRYAAKKALRGLGVYIFVLILLCIPQSSPFRGETGSLVLDSPLMRSIPFLIILLFFIPGFIYARLTKQVDSVKELADILSNNIKDISPFILLAIVIAQFLYFFSESNLGTVLALIGGEFLVSLNLPIFAVCILFLLLVSFVNIFMISGSTKWLIFGPIFVPMLMQIGVHPTFTQVIYKCGDATTNSLSPLNAFFIILLTLVQKYDKKMNVGTIISYMAPYTIGYILITSVVVLAWLFLEIPPGIGSAVFL